MPRSVSRESSTRSEERSDDFLLSGLATDGDPFLSCNVLSGELGNLSGKVLSGECGALRDAGGGADAISDAISDS